MKIGSLCTGYGGLDMAVEAYFNAETVWVSEIDKYASQIIDKHINKPNLGDLKLIDWDQVEPVDILTAGYPCQPFSEAGQRKGLSDERHIWPYILKGISTLRPSYVILENVRGHLSLGLKEVLEGLTQCGYDAKWSLIRASDVGAPHQRARVFIIAYSNGTRCEGSKQKSNGSHQSSSVIANSYDSRRIRNMQGLQSRFNTQSQMSLQAAPNTLEDGRLNPKFVEYMMGLPVGWVTDCGVSRAQQLKILGNGVVPQQAEYAIQTLMENL